MWSEEPSGRALALHRADLHAFLREAAGEVPIRIGLAVERLAQRNGIVSVDFSDATNGEYDLVVEQRDPKRRSSTARVGSPFPPRLRKKPVTDVASSHPCQVHKDVTEAGRRDRR